MCYVCATLFVKCNVYVKAHLCVYSFVCVSVCECVCKQTDIAFELMCARLYAQMKLNASLGPIKNYIV